MSMRNPLVLMVFTRAFFQSCQDIIENNMMELFEEFQLNGKICRSMNSTFIILMSKKDKSIGCLIIVLLV